MKARALCIAEVPEELGPFKWSEGMQGDLELVDGGRGLPAGARHAAFNEFEAPGGRRIGPRPLDDDPWANGPDEDEDSVLVTTALPAPRAKLLYTYDFGDGWRHVVVVEKIIAADPTAAYPRCLAGARSGPPEDCGGPYGYGELLDALAHPRGGAGRELREWAGAFEPEAFGLAAVDSSLRTTFPRLLD